MAVALKFRRYKHFNFAHNLVGEELGEGLRWVLFTGDLMLLRQTAAGTGRPEAGPGWPTRWLRHSWADTAALALLTPQVGSGSGGCSHRASGCLLLLPRELLGPPQPHLEKHPSEDLPACL